MAFQDPNAAALAAGAQPGQTATINGQTFTVQAAENDPLNTPEKWDTPKDARSESGAGKYPNYWSHKTRSGHTMIFDDSKGAEHITLQHRSGSAFQFKPDGSVVFTSHNGQYNVVFGEHRMKISGAHDVVVDGAASLRVAKDYNMTINGNINMTAKGDFNITAKNMNQTIRGNLDVQAKNETKKIEGSSTTQAQGALSLQSGSGSASLTSKSDKAFVGGSKAVAISSTGGEVAISSKGKSSIRAEGAVAIQSAGGKASLSGKTVAIEATGGKASLKGTKAVVEASGDATLKASGTTYVQGGSIKANQILPSGGIIQSGGDSGESADTADDANDVKAEKPSTPVQEAGAIPTASIG